MIATLGGEGSAPAGPRRPRPLSHLALPWMPRPVRDVLGFSLLALALLALAPSSALAARGHVFGFAFGKGVNQTAVEEARSASEQDVCPAPGHPADVCQAGEPGSGPGQFSSEIAGLAVDEATHTVYVVDDANDRIEYFDDRTGAFLGQFDGSDSTAGAFQNPTAIAVDNSTGPSAGDVYVIDRGHRVIDKFTAAGVFINQVARSPETEGVSEPPFYELVGVAVDPTGGLCVLEEVTNKHSGVDNYGNGVVNAWSGFRAIEVPLGGQPSNGIAVDSRSDLYVRTTLGGGGSVLEYDSTGRLLDSELDSAFPAVANFGFATEAGTDDVYINNIGSLGRFGPLGAQGAPELERIGEGHLTTEAEVGAPESLAVKSYRAGVAVDANFPAAASTVFVADSAKSEVQAYLPEQPGPPTVESDSASSVTAESADLEAELNPRTIPGEAPTTYRFEYGPCPGGPAACTGAPWPESVGAGSLPAAFVVGSLSVHLQGLAPATAYHFRLAAANSHSTAPTLGPEGRFTTQPAAPFSLLDSRAWELVSPPDKHGAGIYPILEQEGVIQAAADGEAIAWSATSPTEDGAEGNATQVSVLSARGASGWRSRDLPPPHLRETGTAVGPGREYRFFSTDLSRSLLQPMGAFTPQISPAASEQTPFLRTDFPAGEPTAFCTTGCYRPIVTGCPAAGECPGPVQALADVPAGTVFGEPQCQEERRVYCGPRFEAASPDLAHMIVKSAVPLVEGLAAANQLYEYSAEAPPAESLRPISLLPGGAAATQPRLGSVESESGTGTPISADGSRVVWSENFSTPHLYLRINATESPSPISGPALDGSQCTDPSLACTIRLDLPQEGAAGGAGIPRFQLASADGSRVFFTDPSRLTADASPAGHGGGDLYEYDLEGPLGQRLTDLTADPAEPAAVAGQLLGASEDGSWLYFAAGGVLAHNTVENGGGPEEARPAPECESEGNPAAACNLYLRHAGTTTFLASLSAADRPDWASRLPRHTSRVSPDGRWLAFMSQRPLTGYDNRDAASGRRDEEVFLYHAGEAGGEGALVCASCDPSGARPRGLEYSKLNRGLAGGLSVWPVTTWLAANVPGWTPYMLGGALYQSRYLSDSGRLFFNSSDALAPTDTNGTEDVYEHEPAGVGTCTEASPTWSAVQAGCIGLISSGSSGEESGFLDASEDGDDVFFLTAARLTSADRDTSLDVYDARAPHVPGEAVGFPEAARPVECLGDACQQPATPPDDSTPGSLTFDGPGNAKECPKGKQLKGGRCVAHKKAKKKHKKHKAHHKKAKGKKHAKRQKRATGHKKGGRK